MTDRDAAMDALVEQLATAGLPESNTDDDGDEAMCLTPEGEKVTRQLAISDEGEQDAADGGAAGGG